MRRTPLSVGASGALSPAESEAHAEGAEELPVVGEMRAAQLLVDTAAARAARPRRPPRGLVPGSSWPRPGAASRTRRPTTRSPFSSDLQLGRRRASAAICTANASPSPYQRACRPWESLRWSSRLRQVSAPAPGHRAGRRGGSGRTANGCLLSRVTTRRSFAGPIGGQTDDDRLIGRAGEDLAREGRSSRSGSGRGRRRGRGPARVDSRSAARGPRRRAAGRRGADRPAGGAAVPSASGRPGPAPP